MRLESHNLKVHSGDQYLVFEEFTDKSGWYPHGSIHDNLEEGLEDFKFKSSRYNKYERNFKLCHRTVPEWEEYG